MKIAYKHLLKFIDDKPEIKDLSSKLFQLGHEHEINDGIFEMEFTPNRGDCLSLLGLTRDLNVFYKTKTNIQIYQDEISSMNLNFINKAKDKCPFISFLNIEISGPVSAYKDYLENYFHDLNLNKNNFFTDISNYVAYEMGQPTHCYDYSKIGKDITLIENNESIEFNHLLGDSINLSGSDLIFMSENKMINLSGVIGGIETACNMSTSNALIECAYFQPESIIGKSIKYNINSDASHKFERGTDPACHEKVLRRYIQIVNDHANITKLELYKNSTSNIKEIELDFDLKRVNDILGINITSNEYEKYLCKLGFGVNKKIIVPSYRSDITHQNDIAEELARVIGYDNIPSSSFKISQRATNLPQTYHNNLKSFLIYNGFTEVINSPFSSSHIEKNNESIMVDNPLDSNRNYLRTSLKNSLLSNLIYNENRQKDSIKFFEISDIYTCNQAIKKETRLGIIISGKRGHNHKEFSMKLDNKFLEEVFNKIDFDITKYIIRIDRKEVNSKIRTPIFYIELNTDELFESVKKFEPKDNFMSKFIKYQPISEYPISYRDLSFSVKDPAYISEITKILSNRESPIIKDSFMFDYYENVKMNEIKIGFRYIFQSNERTLTDNEINEEIKEITNSALAIKSVSLPGL